MEGICSLFVVIVVVIIVGRKGGAGFGGGWRGGRVGEKEGGDEVADGTVGYGHWVWMCVDTNRGEAGNVVFGRETAGDEVGRILAVVSKRLWRRENRGNQRADQVL